ncbi:toprim domain-containing protein [Sulfurimonas sp. NW9]|uniref:toprim domain-containing protein n=1 Tax=Sulfurimonas sp. NW9 TaxID=2922728 RepID=UPI003DA952DA
MRLEYDIEALEAISVQDVVIALGGRYPKDREPGMPQYNMSCCNGNFHKEGDKKPSMTIYKSKNICKCHVCGTAGNPISVAKSMLGDFKKACEWLHDTFSIPYKSGSNYSKPKKFQAPKPKQTEYIRFDKSLGFTHVEVREFVKRYDRLNKEQKLKLVYTYLYRFSLTTNHTKLKNYYSSRGIENNLHISKIGFLSEDDIKIVVDKLIAVFKIEDLIEFGILNDASHKYFPLQWKQIKNCLLVPSFSIHTDLVEGFMLRPIDESNKWFKGKESRLSVPSILKPFPFGVGYGVLSKECDIYIAEGHIDALSLPKNSCFIATPGIQAFEPEQLGILQGRNIKLVFDQDDAGQQAAWGFTTLEFLGQTMTVLHSQKDDLEATVRLLKSQNVEVSQIVHEGFVSKLYKAGVKSVEVITWDKKLGKDVNDLLINGNLSKVFKG